jgi:hypothetical protein
LDDWTSQFFGFGATPTSINPWPSGWFQDTYPALQGEAEPIDVPISEVTVLEDSTANGMRTLRLQITPAAGVQDVFVHFRGESVLRLESLNGRPLAGQPAPVVQLNIAGAHQQPVTLDLRASGGGPIQLEALDRRLGLPDTGLQIAPRPQWMAAAPFNDISDSTIVSQVVEVP